MENAKPPRQAFRYAGHSGAAGELYWQGSAGYAWSSGEISTTSVYYLNFSTTEVWPQRSSYKYYGFSVRCIELKENKMFKIL